MEPGRVTFDDKMVVRKAIEEAGIPFTYVSANCFAGYFLGGLCQPGSILPSMDHVVLLGDGNQKGLYLVQLSLSDSFLYGFRFNFQLSYARYPYNRMRVEFTHY